MGAAVRLIANGKMGPLREVHAGSGYWSQDSAVQILGGSAAAMQIWVRWPGGKAVTIDLPTGVREVVVDGEGRIVRQR